MFFLGMGWYVHYYLESYWTKIDRKFIHSRICFRKCEKFIVNNDFTNFKVVGTNKSKVF